MSTPSDLQEKLPDYSDPRQFPGQEFWSDTSDTNIPTTLSDPSPRHQRPGGSKKPPMMVWMPPILQRSPVYGSFHRFESGMGSAGDRQSG